MKPDGRGRIADLLFLVAYVSRREGARVEDVAQRLGISPGEVLAYVDTLLMCGKPPFDPSDFVDIWCDERGRLHVALDQGLGRPIRLTHQEALALAISVRALAASGAAAWAEVAAAALERIRARTAEDVARRVEALEHRIVLEGEDRGTESRFEALSKGLEERREVEIVYYTASRDELGTRRLRPYALVQNLGAWYAIGHDERRGDVLVFKVERIKEARLTDDRFEVPSWFDAEKYRRRRLFVSESERHARVRFLPPLARVVAEEWQVDRIEVQPDGSVIARLDFVGVEGLAAWVLGFGEHAQVVEPEDLCAQVAARCRAALEGYG